MAASALPKPGSKYGPCEGECEHTDCAASRAMAERNCSGCAEKIGYERAFYREDSGDLIHATCAEPPAPPRKGPRVIKTSFEDLAGQTNSGDWKILSPDEAERLKRALQREDKQSEAGAEPQP